MVFFLLVVFGLLSFTSSQISHQYHFINIRKNWTEAQRFCREKYTDLATVNNADEMNSLFKSISDVSYDAYIGLYRSEVFRWHWSLPDSYNVETFQNWNDKQPDINQNKEGCAVMDNNGEWFNDSCDSQRQFICFNATANQKYILIEVNKSWREAQEHCRTFHTDLASARNSSENRDIKNTFKKNDVWIGLFKDPWSWSDQTNSSFRFWNSSQLSIRRGQDCVSVMGNKTGKWKDVQCNATQPFICFGATPGAATTTETRPAQNTTEGGNTSSQPTQILTTGVEQATPGAATTTETRPAQNTTEGGNTSSQPTQILTTGVEQAPPSIYRPITESVVFGHPGCQICSSYHSCSYKHSCWILQPIWQP
ncbi:putative C-type lectin domain family 20 member A isoform X2 [Pseudorasbora parva]|uniref:putative C-type lectin domain family 20 member A isoform X2 n=1 Tax=Pseudorasbora parva TaxID=51549 RepID=UPI00351E00B2